MSDNNKTSNKNVRFARYSKILVLVLIILAVTAVYLFKYSSQKNEITNSNSDTKEAVSEEQSFAFDLHVTEAIDLESLKSYGLPIVIDFGADECIPCKEMAPVLENLNEELEGKAIILFVDVWKYQELAASFPIRVIPTQVLIDSEGNPFTPGDSLDVPLTMYSSNETKEHVFTTHEGGLSEDILIAILQEMGLDK